MTYSAGKTVMLSTLSMFVTCVCIAAQPGELLSRQQISQCMDAGGKIVDVELRQQTGWETIRGFSWKVEVEDPQKPAIFAPADASQTFHHWQRFRIQVEAYCDLYAYVLVRNTDGSEEILLPQRAEQVPRIAKGKTYALPTDGTAFRFDPPAGSEKLRLIVSPVELPWVTSRELFRLQNGQRLDSQERTQLGRFKSARTKSMDAALERQQKLPQVRSLAEAAKEIAVGQRARGCEVVATDLAAEGNLVLVASADPNSKAVLVCDIVLTHED